MQVYLPDDLYKLVKAGHLPASELLQEAVRAEVRRLEILRETDRYVADLTAQVGRPDAHQRTRAKAIVQRVVERGRREAS
jgi:post-segregation antitoxin (ccd killing protein)